MPIKIKISIENMEWGQTLYVMNDPDQNAGHLVGIEFLPGGAIKYKIKYFADMEPTAYYDFECTLEPGEVKKPTVDED